MEKLANPSRRRLFRGEIKKPNALRLPWIISETVFTEKCTQCNRCIDVCETNIISRDSEGYPIIDFEKGECTLCIACHEVCAQPLFFHRLSTGEYPYKPWTFELAINQQCLAKKEVYCQSCMDVCESNAINFHFGSVDKKSRIPQPEILLDDCTQCGACIASCPQSAIVLEMN